MSGRRWPRDGWTDTGRRFPPGWRGEAASGTETTGRRRPLGTGPNPAIRPRGPIAEPDEGIER